MEQGIIQNNKNLGTDLKKASFGPARIHTHIGSEFDENLNQKKDPLARGVSAIVEGDKRFVFQGVTSSADHDAADISVVVLSSGK